MSFSSEAKAEICQAGLRQPCCARAEAYGVLLFCNTFTQHEIRVTTQSPAFARRLPRLFQAAFGLELEQMDPTGAGRVTFTVTRKPDLEVLLDSCGLDRKNTISLHINYALLEEDCCRRSFLRGAFLAGGSVINPEKRYQLELVTSHYHVGQELDVLLRECSLSGGKSVVRKGNYVTYFKFSESIEDFLTAIGAPQAAMEIMNTKLEKQMRNAANRFSNCDLANVEKSVGAAQASIDAIRRLQAKNQLDGLPMKLQNTARLRMENPELSMSELAQHCGISKSGLNHRLRKLTELADRLEE